jgi:integrase
MPTRALTAKFCDNAKAQPGDAQTDYFDENVTGLALRVSTAGKKSWTYLFTWGGKRARMALGTYPATTHGNARSHAEAAKADLESGKDPRSSMRTPETIKAVCDEYFRREGGGLRTGAYRAAALARLVYPSIGDRAIHEVRRSDLVRLFDKINDECGAVMADHALAYLRRIFTWYSARSDDFRSPIVRGMARTKPKERARERTLTDEELRAVWKTAERRGTAFDRLVQFILLTAARRAEAAEMTWTELTGSDWTLPAARNKTKVDLVRPLSQDALGVLPQKIGKFVFSTSGENPVSGFSKFKMAFDKAVTVEAGAPLPNWTLHDLRRTARSLMSRAGVSSDHAERCLGHVISGVRGTYDRHDFHSEKANAFQSLERNPIILYRPHIHKI